MKGALLRIDPPRGSLRMTLITEALLHAGCSVAGGWKKAQLALIGVPWPPPAGWKARVIGLEISDEAAARFVALRDGAMTEGPPALPFTS